MRAPRAEHRTTSDAMSDVAVDEGDPAGAGDPDRQVPAGLDHGDHDVGARLGDDHHVGGRAPDLEARGAMG